jgi:hypothetical protein
MLSVVSVVTAINSFLLLFLASSLNKLINQVQQDKILNLELEKKAKQKRNVPVDYSNWDGIQTSKNWDGVPRGSE